MLIKSPKSPESRREYLAPLAEFNENARIPLLICPGRNSRQFLHLPDSYHVLLHLKIAMK